MGRPRYLELRARADLAEKMLFIAGPRQVGKTTLARRIMAASESSAYFNRDNRGDRAERRALAGRERAGGPGRNPQVAGMEGLVEGSVRPAPGPAAISGITQVAVLLNADNPANYAIVPELDNTAKSFNLGPQFRRLHRSATRFGAA